MSRPIGDEPSPDEVSEALATLDRSGGRASAVVLLRDAPWRVVWADTHAVALFGTADALELTALLASDRSGLDPMLRRIADAGHRRDRVRIVQGIRSRTLPVLVGRVPGQDGRDLYVLTTPVQAASSAALLSGLVWPDANGGPVPDAALPDAQPSLPPGRSPRLLWRTDAAHRLASLDGAWPELLGLDGALLGKPLAEALAGNDALKAALASQASWSGVEVAWPLVRAGWAVPVSLGAAALTDPAQGFVGFRGYGVVHPARLHEVPLSPDAGRPDLDAALAVPVQEAAPPEQPADTGDVRVEAAPAPPPEPAVVEGEAPPPGQGETTAAKVERDDRQGSKVVALRPNQWGNPQGGSLQQGRAGQEGERAAWHGDLSSTERSAFNEIARTLAAEWMNRETRVHPPVPVEAEAAAPATLSDAAGPSAPAALVPHFGVAAGHDEAAAAVLDRLPIAAVVAVAGYPLHVNPAFQELTRYGSAETLAEAGGLRHLFGGLDPARVLDRAGEKACPITDGAGQVVPVEARLSAVAWEEGEADLVTLRRAPDWVARVESLEIELRRRERDVAETRAVLQLAETATVVLDDNGRIVLFNHAAERLFGCTAASVAGDPFTLLLDARSHPDAMNLVLATQIGDQDGGTLVDVVPRPARPEVPVLQMRAQQLGQARVCLTFREPSSEHTMMRDRSEARVDLDQVKVVRSDFLAKLSHEIRTPLNAILGFAEVMLEERFGPVGNPRYRDYVRDMHDAGTRVMTLVNDLLDLSRLETGQAEMKPDLVDVNRIVGDCVHQMQPNAHRERVIMRLSLMPRLPAALIDEQAFRQVMLNVLSNALRFNEAGGQVIVSTTLNEAGAVAVRVRDTGIGMTEAEVAQAAEPFRQINTGKPGGGNGLGLPLARALVEANHATLAIRSRKAEGTLVEIVLRASPAEPMRVPAE